MEFTNELDVSSSTINRPENGRFNPNYEFLNRLAPLTIDKTSYSAYQSAKCGFFVQQTR